MVVIRPSEPGGSNRVINRNLLKATFVAGALATGGAIAGIAGAAAAPSGSSGTTATQTQTQSTTPTTPAPQRGTQPPSGHPCPHMGKSSGSGSSGSSYQGSGGSQRAL
jgi:hypothetical protein